MGPDHLGVGVLVSLNGVLHVLASTSPSGEPPPYAILESDEHVSPSRSLIVSPSSPSPPSPQSSSSSQPVSSAVPLQIPVVVAVWMEVINGHMLSLSTMHG